MTLADDVVLVGESLEKVNKKLEYWRIKLGGKGKGLRISKSKSVTIVYDFEGFQIIKIWLSDNS